MMPILVKSDDVRSGRKAKARRGWLQAAGVNGLMRKWVDVLLAKKCSHNNEVAILTR